MWMFEARCLRLGNLSPNHAAGLQMLFGHILIYSLSLIDRTE